LETLGGIFALCDVLIVAWALHKLYHGMFAIVYFGLGAYLKELLITLILAYFLVEVGSKAFGVDLKAETLGLGGFLYLAGFFAVSVFLIVHFNKPKKN
jgi:hypothetical protein